MDLKKKIEEAIKRYQDGIVYWSQQINTLDGFNNEVWYLHQKEKAEAIVKELRLLLE